MERAGSPALGTAILVLAAATSGVLSRAVPAGEAGAPDRAIRIIGIHAGDPPRPRSGHTSPAGHVYVVLGEYGADGRFVAKDAFGGNPEALVLYVRKPRHRGVGRGSPARAGARAPREKDSTRARRRWSLVERVWLRGG